MTLAKISLHCTLNLVVLSEKYSTSKIFMETDKNWQKRMPKSGRNLLVFGDKFLVISILNSEYMHNATLRNDENGKTLWVRKMLSCMISAKNKVFTQNNVKISSGQIVLNFLGFFGVQSFSIKPKLGVKVQLKVQNIDLSVTITHINTQKILIYPSL